MTAARCEQWKGISLDDLEDFPVYSHLPLEEDITKSDPELTMMRGEMRNVLRATIQDELTEKQKLVLKWMVFEEVPMDVVVQYLCTNRNAVYKLLHDARSSLKRGLMAQGLGIGESIDLFSSQG